MVVVVVVISRLKVKQSEIVVKSKKIVKMMMSRWKEHKVSKALLPSPFLLLNVLDSIPSW